MKENLEHGKLPPQAVDFEIMVLGAVMLEKQASFIVKNILQPEHFYKEIHQKIYSAILELDEETSPIDIMTVTQQMKKRGELDLVGGPYYITQLTNRVASAANIEYHSMIILQMAVKRKQIKLGSEIITQGYDDTIEIFDTNELISTTANELLTILEPSTQKNNSDLIREVIHEMEFAKKHDGISGIKSGFGQHDNCTHGWQKSDLIYIAARPSMGKTAYVVSMAKNMAYEFGNDVAFFSLEMKGPKIMSRLISNEIQMPLTKIQEGKLDANELQTFHKGIRRLTGDKLHIFDDIMTIQGIKSKCLEMHLNGKLDIVIIDYLQLVEYPGFKGNREGEVSKISRMLKKLAMELDIPIICLSQLSREPEKRSNKNPQLSDLRESGSIEQDADVVEFLLRPSYYDMDNSPNDLALVLIKKHRNGELATIKMKFTGKFVQFSDWEGESFDPNNPGDDLPY